jgi:hypothetical protein
VIPAIQYIISYILDYIDNTKALERLSFRRPFSVQTYQKFTTKQEEVITAQYKRMGSTKALIMPVYPHVILPPGGNDQWAMDENGKVKAKPKSARQST